MSIGDYKRPPYFSVVGDAVAFYVWTCKGPGVGKSSQWIRGRHALWKEVRSLHENRKKRKFTELVERLAKEYDRG
jgi:hypothetical protein